MKKRIRKKRHCGEFTEFGRQLIIIRNKKEGFDEFVDAFIRDAIESNECTCGGGGQENKLRFVVQLGRRSGDPDAKLNRIIMWLKSRYDVESWILGEEYDIWNGDCHYIDEAQLKSKADLINFIKEHDNISP